MYRGLRVAVVIPAYQEERLVTVTLAHVPDFVDVVVVVDDASADSTGAAVTRWSNQRHESRVRLLRHATNRGVGASIASGYAEALRADADVLVVMAGDNQMDAQDLPALLEPIAEGVADYVKGNRFAHREMRRMPWPRRVAGRALAACTRLASGLQVTDTQCGYTALRASTARELPLHRLWPRYGYPNDLLLLLARAGARVREVPVRPVYATEQSGVRPWHAAVVAFVIARRWCRPESGN